MIKEPDLMGREKHPADIQKLEAVHPMILEGQLVAPPS
jgi:hypothetical protein